MNVEKHRTWPALRRRIDELRDTGDEFLWRGQGNAAWRLESTIYRFFESQCAPQADRRERESQAEQFFLKYLSAAKDVEVDLRHRSQILMLMQHYGCPTRMLDWTKSPYVAAYFAVQDQAEVGALFALNLTKYQSLVAERVVLDDYDGGVLNVIPRRVFGHLDRDSITFPIPLVPDPITAREFEQQTAFLVDMQLEKPLETFFFGRIGDYLWKFEFDRAVRPSIARDLLAMNIDGRHMFQGLGGVALRAREHLVGEKVFGHTTGDPNSESY